MQNLKGRNLCTARRQDLKSKDLSEQFTRTFAVLVSPQPTLDSDKDGYQCTFELFPDLNIKYHFSCYQSSLTYTLRESCDIAIEMSRSSRADSVSKSVTALKL